MRDNYFALFGIKPDLEIDLNHLQQEYFKLQQQYHPDKNKSGADESAKLNLAYTTLRNRFKRLEYIVKTMGSGNLVTDKSLLMEVMELREEHEENPTEVEKRIEAEIEELFKQAGLDFKANKMDDVAARFTKIKYLQNVITNT